jgi:hypothetical protein
MIELPTTLPLAKTLLLTPDRADTEPDKEAYPVVPDEEISSGASIQIDLTDMLPAHALG